MVVLKCKACGAPLNVSEGQKIVECLYCDLQQTVPQMDNEFKLQMFNQANDMRRNFDFDGAKAFLQAVLTQNPEESEAYWGICLCKYGIMYVEDQQTGAQIPTFYRMIPQSILSDPDYLKACEYAGSASWKYTEEAEKIEKLQKKILQLTNEEEPYDIFICYKKTNPETGLLTEDSHIANQIYTKLIESGYRVFWAERSLPIGCEYEPYIYSALSTAKIMLVLGTDKAYFEATWVKNEWIRFLDMMTRESSKTIMTCYKNMDAEDIPASLRSLQALDMGDMLFSSDMLDRIKKKLPKKKNDKGTSKEEIESLIKSYVGNQKNGKNNESKREVNLKDGVYVGDTIAGRPHGDGICYLTNGNRYEGSWVAGNKSGKGTFYYKDGSSWTGEWENDYPYNGEGVLQGDDGTIDGEVREGNPWNAKVTYVMQINEDMKGAYEGTLVKGKASGEGKIALIERKELIEGTFEDGFNGEVVWYFKNGYRFEGTMKDGYPIYGRYIRKNDSLAYEGQFKRLAKHGKGIYYWPDGNRYEGEFEYDKRHGHGTLYYNKGAWTGQWTGQMNKDQCWTGDGLILYYDNNGKPTGAFYNGRYVNGKANGKGIWRNEDGERFVGVFLNDKYHDGKLYNSQNRLIGIFTNGYGRGI